MNKNYQLVYFMIFIIFSCGGGPDTEQNTVETTQTVTEGGGAGNSGNNGEIEKNIGNNETSIPENNGLSAESTYEERNIDMLSIPEGFNFKMVKQVSISICLTTDAGIPLPNVTVEILTNSPENGGEVIAETVTDINGYYSIIISVPSATDRLYVRYRYIGVGDGTWLLIKGNDAEILSSDSHHLLDTLGKMAAIIYDYFFPTAYAYYEPLNDAFQYAAPYNTDGVPDNLTSPGDAIDASFLADINASLPERRPVPQYHPSYIASGAESNTILLEQADVWVTFVHEGAGYKNVLGYYTYNKNSPPQSTSDIDNYTIIFPNASYHNSDGGLYSGDKVYLGSFPKDTAIGYFLIANGWDQSSKTNNDGIHIFYSNASLNPESSSEAQKHNVLLWDNVRDKIILGFEDINRENQGCDQDFNDAVFYLTVNPATAVDTSSLQPVDTPNDADSDGISDIFDKYPNDPERAFDNYYPSQNTYGTLAFEDLWPNKGDYDFNDLVVDYNFRYVTNSDSEIIDIYPTFVIMAVGANYRNGFAFSLPIPSNAVAAVTGSEIHESFIELNQNNTEAGQNNAVIIAWDNTYRVIEKPSGYMVNTETGAPYVAPATLNMGIHLAAGIPISQIGLPPYNPFIIINRQRGYEVHLAGYPPTDLADTGLFGSGVDVSDTATNTYYITDTQLPWALDVPYEWDYMREKTSILSGYLNFATWAESGGTQNIGWYNRGVQNRDDSKIWSGQ